MSITEAQLKLRKEVFKILTKKYGHENNSKAIEVCADEWVSKYVISAGVVDYYNAYKQSFINKSLSWQYIELGYQKCKKS